MVTHVQVWFFLPVFAAALIFFGCAGTGVRPELIEFKKHTERTFRDNLASYEPKSEAERAIIDILKTIQKGVETFDLPVIEKVLSRDFTLRYATGREHVVIQTREEFLEKRRSWKHKLVPKRRVLMSLVSLREIENTLLVGSLTTHQSKYFNPRFVEQYVFEREAPHLLKTWVVVPVYPAKAELFEPQIFIGRFKTGYWTSEIEDAMSREGPDVLIDEYLTPRYSRFPRDGVRTPVLVLFREPPPPGTVVDFEEDHYVGGSVRNVFRSPVHVSGANPYFFIRGSGWWFTRADQSVVIRIRVDGKVIHEETIFVD